MKNCSIQISSFQVFKIDLCAHLEEVLGSEGVSQLPKAPEEVSAVTVLIVGPAEAGEGGHDNDSCW